MIATPEADPQRWLSQKEAARYLGVTGRTLRSYAAAGQLRAHRIKGSRLVRYRRSDLDAVLSPIPSMGDVA